MDWGFGLTLMIAGMLVTILTLILLGYIIRLMIKLFPYTEEKGKE